MTDPGYPKGIVMIAELDAALHGTSYARDASPREVWEGLLREVSNLVLQVQEDAGA